MRSLSKFLVSKKKFQKNLNALSSYVSSGNHQLIPMVKAEAYGHGMFAIADWIIELTSANEINGFGVATIIEGMALRKNLEIWDGEIYIFSECDLINKKEIYIDFGLTPILSQVSDLEFFLQNKMQLQLPMAIKLNTGMNRLGFQVDEMPVVINLLKKHNVFSIDLLLTHYAHSFDSKTDSIQEQQQIFIQLKQMIEVAGIECKKVSLSNSGAIEHRASLPSEVLRPGLMLYGIKNLEAIDSSFDLKCISALETIPLSLKRLNKGEKFGYGLTELIESGFLLLLPLGYADGMKLGFTGIQLEIEGVNCQIVGRINMDITYLFSTDVRIQKFMGKKIRLWSFEQDQINHFAKKAHSIPYDILTSISSRVPRDYLIE